MSADDHVEISGLIRESKFVTQIAFTEKFRPPYWRDMSDAPAGTFSFLFTDIVGSTRLWEQFPLAMGAALARHEEIIRGACLARNGHIFKTVGDAFCVAFPTPLDALWAAMDSQRALAAETWGEVGTLSVRMGIHTGAAEMRGGDYFGGTLNRSARIEAAAHGGQILISQITAELLEDDRPAGVGFQSLGSHRLRNLERPEHLYQVTAPGLPTGFPPPKSMEILPNNLPVQSTSFIGRDREMADLRRVLEKSRLITLIGTGGTGKTRLALETGAQVINEFPDGVWLAELAPISDPSRIVEVVAGALGVREEAERPLRQTLTNFLRSKNLLLILDNCEHLLAATASLAADLLRACPKLKILAASRHSLGIAGESTFPVPPLGMLDTRLHELTGPDILARLSQFDAVKLFIERATAVRPDFVVTNANAPALAEVCSRLDGIPLAIELAAARIRVLDIGQIAARLGDRFQLLRGGSRAGLPHQQTLQALIDWSHDLLSDEERIVFRRLGVFVGGRTLGALETVCSGGGIEEFAILDLLQQLVDKSLVTVERDPGGESRYTMIESVWQYAREKLEDSGEGDAVRDRHLDYFLSWAEKASPRLEGPEQKDWLDLAQREVFNFRFAFEWAIKSRNTAKGIRLINALYRLIEIRSNLEEAREVSDRLMALEDEGVSTKLRADFRISAGRLAWAADRYDEAVRLYAEAQPLYDSIGDEAGSALADMLTAFINRGNGHHDEAERRFQRGREVGRRLHRAYLEAGCLSGLGSIALDRGDLVAARTLKEESLAIYERLGDRWIVGLILWGLTQVAIAQKDYVRAESALKDWSDISRELGNRWILPYILECHGNLALDTGDPQRAARLFGASDLQREHSGAQFSPSEQKHYDALLARLREVLSEEQIQAARESVRGISAWEVIA
ncbi:MAG TPA: adenylate/guanylate cyclase domain-containing protein [Terrimicrobiaceae bacterium]|nr:adenylate/guanylate cyclase domain-containing protein [Terrimicrobiaceae bacterium]